MTNIPGLANVMSYEEWVGPAPIRTAPVVKKKAARPVAPQQLMRWDLLNALAPSRARFLEIGVCRGTCGARVRAAERIGVDPAPARGAERHYRRLFREPSDAFFRRGGLGLFDLVFIDGLHHAEQVYRDILGAARHLEPGGSILLHDCNPKTELAGRVPRQTSHWNGDCWKAIAKIRASHPELAAFVVDTDEGIGIVQRSTAPQPLIRLEKDAFQLSWRDLQSHRVAVLGLVPPGDWRAAMAARFPMPAVSVISAVFGPVRPPSPAAAVPGVRCLCYTDAATVPAGWELRRLPGELLHALGPRRANRYVKTHALELLPDAEVVVYADAEFEVAGDIRLLVGPALGSSDIAVFRHPDRVCVYQELDACRSLKKAPADALSRQAARYRGARLPERSGLWALGVLGQRNTAAARAFSQAWWKEIHANHTDRDQPSFGYVAWRDRLRPAALPGELRRPRFALRWR
jgi:hypothetical protein